MEPRKPNEYTGVSILVKIPMNVKHAGLDPAMLGENTLDALQERYPGAELQYSVSRQSGYGLLLIVNVPGVESGHSETAQRAEKEACQIANEVFSFVKKLWGQRLESWYESRKR